MLAQIKVVLADDDAENDFFFNHSLVRLDLSHKIFYARNASELFQILEKESDLDLAIIDIEMPGKDGKQCLSEMKTHNEYRKIPVIIMTNSINDTDVDETYRTGAHYYVIKPYSLNNYVETIKRVFNVDWKIAQPVPSKENFVINLAFA